MFVCMCVQQVYLTLSLFKNPESPWQGSNAPLSIYIIGYQVVGRCLRCVSQLLIIV